MARYNNGFIYYTSVFKISSAKSLEEFVAATDA